MYMNMVGGKLTLTNDTMERTARYISFPITGGAVFWGIILQQLDVYAKAFVGNWKITPFSAHSMHPAIFSFTCRSFFNRVLLTAMFLSL